MGAKATVSAPVDSIADLLSTNNTINIATLIFTILFGAVAVASCYFTWRHQRWERQDMDRRRQTLADTGTRNILYASTASVVSN